MTPSLVLADMQEDDTIRVASNGDTSCGSCGTLLVSGSEPEDDERDLRRIREHLSGCDA